MTALDLISFGAGFAPQGVDEFGEGHLVVAAFDAHVTIDTGPDCLVLWSSALPSQSALCYKTGVEVWITLSNRADNCALATVKAESHLCIIDLLVHVEHIVYYQIASH